MSAIRRKGPRPKFGGGQEVRLCDDEPVYTIVGIDETDVEIPEYRLADASGEVVLSVAIKDQRLLRRADAKARQRHPGYRIEKIEHAVEIALTLRQSWFRGHTRQHRTLVPGIFRDHHYNETYRALVPDYEASIYRSFRRRAPAILERIPTPEDDEGWLFVMQHHGSPTRLLDWTENALAALYFAVRACREITTASLGLS